MLITLTHAAQSPHALKLARRLLRCVVWLHQLSPRKIDQLDTLKTRLEATKTKFQAKSTTGLTGEQITGDIFSANIWSWFAMVEGHSMRLNSYMAPPKSVGLRVDDCGF